MRLRAATLFALDIPFVESFRHSATSRAASDSIVVRLEAEGDAGVFVGHGEGVARPYVTGETVDGALSHAAGTIWPALAGRALPAADGPHLLEALAALVPDDLPGEEVVAWNGIRCAFELALADLVLGAAGRSVGAVLPPATPAVVYSGVITAGAPEKAAEHAKRFALFGVRQLKIKIGAGDDEARVAAVRAAVGPEASLRLDANGAFDHDGALRLLDRLAPLRIDSVEQPLPRGPARALARLRAASPVPILVDESLVTTDDARALADAGACDLFNLRVSKNGGLARTLRIAALAREAGIALQVGAQVGETAILSAAGRHLAAHLAPRFVEGSYGPLLLAADVARDPVSFGHGGKGALLRGPGLGVKVEEARLARHAARVIRLGAAGGGA